MNQTATQETSITHIWSRFNVQWLKTGALAGIAAGTVVLILAMVVSSTVLGEWSQPLKLLGAGVFGEPATAFGPLGASALVGALIHYSLSILFGVTFAQLVDETSSVPSLLALGIVCSLIIWVFGCMLFLPSVNLLLRQSMSTPFSVLLHVLFGLSFAIFLSLFRSGNQK